MRKAITNNKKKVIERRSSSSLTKSNTFKHKLNPKAKANFTKVKGFINKISRFTRPIEFAGKGKVIEILNVNTDANSPIGEVMTIEYREPETNKIRIWNTSSIRALTALSPLLEKGISLIRIWTTGTGMDKLYHAEDSRSKSKTKGTPKRKK